MPPPFATEIAASGLWPAGVLLFCALAIGHALADYPLQGEFLATTKDRHAAPPAGGPWPRHLWAWSLSMHSLIHAGAVWLVTGLGVLALAEFALHWLIDFAKCERWTGFGLDQILHLACKAGYVLAIAWGLAR
jgi:hypothetical protein